MAKINVPELKLTERDLRHWRLIDDFRHIVERVFEGQQLHPSLSDPKRKTGHVQYLSLFLFGLFNPVVESMRGLCAATELQRVQEEVCGRAISRSTFSEMQHMIDPELLQQVFTEAKNRTYAQRRVDSNLAHLNLIAQDGSLWRALPRMAWAEYGVGAEGQAKGVRLHLRFNVLADQPEAARVDIGKSCEREALRQMCVQGQTSVGDRYYGGDYKLFWEVDQAGGFFVFRIKEQAVLNDVEEIPISAADKAAGVVRHFWARLGAHEHQRSMRLRVVEVRTRDQHLLLVTNLPLAENPAELVSLIYRQRWSIELFFRWIKCILGCRHFFAESPEGAAIELYLALIASLLFQLYSGRRPSKRLMERIQFYQMGWATAEEMEEFLAAEAKKQKTP